MTAQDLLSLRVVVGLAEERLQDVAERMQAQGADHCVVLDHDRRNLVGLVRLRDVALRTSAGNRILADLVSPILPLTVMASEPIEAVLSLVEDKGVVEIVVLAPTGGYLGLITAESALSWLQVQHRADRRNLEETLAERQRLNDLLDRKVQERHAEIRQALDGFESACLSLSHDLRTPLRSMEAFARQLREGACGALNPAGVDISKRIERAAQKLQTVASELLGRAHDAFGPKPAAQEIVDLNQVLEDVIELHHVHFTSRNALIQKRANLPMVPGRYVPILQIMSNLLSNAVRYVPEGRQPTIELWSEPAGGQVVLFVKDNGRGIAGENTRRIFEPFTRLEPRQFNGTGLGLTIARQAASEIGAVIAVQSEPGAGAVFSVTLGLPVGGSTP